MSTDEVMYYVMDEATRLWSRLETLYMTKSLTNMQYLKIQLYGQYLKIQLYGLRMKEGTTLLEYLNFFNNVIS